MEGVEMTAGYRPDRWISLAVPYTWLETASPRSHGTSIGKISMSGEAPVRRHQQSGTMVTNFQNSKTSANVVGYFRGQDPRNRTLIWYSAGVYRNLAIKNSE